MFCFISVAQMEMKKPSAKVWLVLTCCSIAAAVWVLLNTPSIKMQEYAYQPRPPNIILKELKPQPVQEDLPEQVPAGEPEEILEPAEVEKKAMVVVNNLNIRDTADINAPVLETTVYGQIMTVLEDPIDADWARIKTETGLTGWVVKRYLRFLPEE